MEPSTTAAQTVLPATAPSQAEVDKENSGADVLNPKGKPKVDYEKRYLDHIKKLAEKKQREQQEVEEARVKMVESREKLKKLVLARAEKLRQFKEMNANIDNNNEAVAAEEAKGLDLEDKKKLMEKGKLRKYFRSRYASLLQTLQENAKAKKAEEEKRKKHQDEVHQKLMNKLGIDQVQSRVMKEPTKPAAEEISGPGTANPGAKPTMSGTVSVLPTSAGGAATGLESEPTIMQKRRSVLDEKKVTQTTTFKANGMVTHKGNGAAKVPAAAAAAEDTKDGEEKKRLAKEAAEKILQRQQQYLQAMLEKKQQKEKEKEEAKEKKEKMMKKLADKARVQLEEHQAAPKEESKEVKPAEPTKKLSKQEMEGFLARNMIAKKTADAPITDFGSWKKRHRITDDTKVFIVTGGYGDIKKALKKRGWLENKQQNSNCFDFKWVINNKEIDYSSLQEYQVVNHFDKNGVITTKVGLCHNLRNLIWYNNVDIDTFYPRSFDMVESGETADFVEEFKSVKAESVLKEFQLSGGKIESVGEEKLLVALNICERRLRDIDDILDEAKQELTLVTPEEWEVLGTNELTPDMLAKKKHEGWFKRIMKKFNRKKAGKKGGKKKAHASADKKAAGSEVAEPEPADTAAAVSAQNAEEEASNKELRQRVVNTLSELRKRYPQFDMNGYRNIWIVKPAGLSRGRGIRIFNSLAEILDYGRSREQQYIAMKYIENPMTIMNRKYDLRQWVMVTNWSPLTVWFYQECYVRFGAMEYNIQDISNRFMHLTNNSVTKHYEGPEPEGEIEGNMWEQSQFAEYLKVSPASSEWRSRNSAATSSTRRSSP